MTDQSALILQKLEALETHLKDRLKDHDETIDKLSHIITGNGTPGLCEQVRENLAVHRNLEKRFEGAITTARYWIGGTFFLILGQWVKYFFEKVFPLGG